jgi:thioredoxin-dependent peroxiredoxin
MLSEKLKAPNFKLKDKDGQEHQLNKINSKFTIIYFYPKDNTPGCTIEAKMFNKYLENFEKMDTKIIGISGGDEKSKTKFCEKHDLKLLLLSDPEFEVSKAYKAYGEKFFMGRRFMGIHRYTYVLDKNKKVIKLYDRVKPADHPIEVLNFIKEQK